MKFKRTRTVKVGSLRLGGTNPVRVQAMCNTDTRDVAATVKQIIALENAGCEIIRAAIPDMEAARAVSAIKRRIHIPFVADIHFDYKLAIECVRRGADKIRINPGNIGSAANVREVARSCRDAGVPIRIGVNAGSLRRLKEVSGRPRWNAREWARIMAEEALEQADMLDALGFRDLLVSLKADDSERTIAACELFASKSDIPQHIGVTEAGSLLPGAVKSALTLGALLREGIGATIRVSLTEDPALQVRCAYEILKALGLREYGPDIISCPTCGRCRADVAATVKALEKRIYSDRQLLSSAEGRKIAVMGCAVNGPGEARDADFGIAGGVGEGVWIEKGRIGRKIPRGRWVSAIINRIKKR